MEEKDKQKGKILREEIIRDDLLGWEIVPVENPDGTILFYLNKLYKGKRPFKFGSIICNKSNLKSLKKFLKEREGI